LPQYGPPRDLQKMDGYDGRKNMKLFFADGIKPKILPLDESPDIWQSVNLYHLSEKSFSFELILHQYGRERILKRCPPDEPHKLKVISDRWY
jgi:hypothetical protein